MSPRMLKIIELREKGLTHREICNEINIKRGLLCVYLHILIKKKLIKKIGKKERKRRQSVALKYKLIDIDKAKGLRDRGYSNNQIAKMTGISKITIAKHLGPVDKKTFLTRKQRIILWLRQQDFTYEQIAKRLHLHPGTIASAFNTMRKNGHTLI